MTAALFPSRCAPADDLYPQTEAGDAERFADSVAGRVLYDHARRQWCVFGPHHWRPDATGSIIQLAIDAMRRRQAAALDHPDPKERGERLRRALAGESEARLRHMLELASTHPRLALAGTEWDLNPWLLGVVNGTLDLRTGHLYDGRPEDRITRAAAVAFDPAAPAPRWARFVLDIADDDPDLAGFLQRSLGYCLTGRTTEQCFWIWYGLGANGKSTLIETITRHVLPDHAWTMSFPVQAWTEALSEYQRAELVGRRIVSAKESEQAKRLNSEFLKSLTGCDTVNARRPYGRPFTFVPTAKFILCCNHKPIIRDESHGMWRRVHLVPFTRTFPVDPTFGDRLAAEAEGILAWLLDGCLAWQRDGLHVPRVVTDATAQYQQESDTLAEFLDRCCVVADYASVRAGILYDAYVTWATTDGLPDHDRLTKRTFGERLKARFATSEGRHVTYHGVGLRSDEP